MYSCNLCKEQGEDFTAPADEIGAALMKQHLKSEHGEEI